MPDVTSAGPTLEPMSAGALRELRLRWRRAAPSAGLGAHRHRRAGQSLTFRDYRDYAPGDDARRIDWSASARRGDGGDWVVRNFESEERRSLLLLLDCRAGMFLPEALPKIAVVLWIADALARIAAAEGDDVRIGTVGGPWDDRPRRGADLPRLTGALAGWSGGAAGRRAAREMVPAGMVVLITDALFGPEDGGMTRLARDAQRSFRSFHLVELDAWPLERALMETGPFSLTGGIRDGSAEAVFDADAAALDAARVRIDAHLAHLRAAFRGPGLVWPARGVVWPRVVAPGTVGDWLRGAVRQSDAIGSILARA